MAFKGNLRDFSVLQLFNLITLAKKSGELSLEISAEKAQVSFLSGRLVHVQIIGENSNLSEILHNRKRISHHQELILHEESERLSDQEFGLQLVNAGYLTQEEILTTLQDHYLDIVRQLFTWVEGRFCFEAGKPLSTGNIPLDINLENEIADGMRRLHEREYLQGEIPDLSLQLKITDKSGAIIRNLNLSPEELRAVKLINGKKSINDIALAIKMDDFEIRRLVYGLLKAGAAELIYSKGTPYTGVTTKLSLPQDKDQNVSLVDRLINRKQSE